MENSGVRGQRPAERWCWRCKTGSDPTNLPASRAARRHPTPPRARTDPERRTTDGVTPASSPPARLENFTRTRPAPMSTAVKPSAQPTLVRTQHLPPPAKTARSLRKRGPAGRFLLVPLCVMVCRRRSWRSDRYGQIADSVRAEGAVRGTACFADPCPFCPVMRAPSPDWCIPRIPGGRFLRRSARDGRRAGLVRTRGPGQASASARAIPSRAATEAVTGCAPPARRVEDWHGAVVSDAARGSGRCASGGVGPQGFPGIPSQGLDLVEPVMYLSWTGDVPVVHRSARASPVSSDSRNPV